MEPANQNLAWNIIAIGGAVSGVIALALFFFSGAYTVAECLGILAAGGGIISLLQFTRLSAAARLCAIIGALLGAILLILTLVP